jgi:hypothetical protein
MVNVRTSTRVRVLEYLGTSTRVLEYLARCVHVYIPVFNSSQLTHVSAQRGSARLLQYCNSMLKYCNSMLNARIVFDDYAAVSLRASCAPQVCKMTHPYHTAQAGLAAGRSSPTVDVLDETPRVSKRDSQAVATSSSRAKVPDAVLDPNRRAR